MHRPDLRICIWIVLFACVFPTTAAALTVPDPGTYVVDKANLIDERAELRLEELLTNLQKQKGAQMKVLTVASTEGEAFFDFVHRHASQWALGQKGADNGVLIALALNEREVRIHTGYGMESILPDEWCGATCRRIAQQYFKTGNYSEGLYQLTSETVAKISSSNIKPAKPSFSIVNTYKRWTAGIPSEWRGLFWFLVVAVAVFVIALIPNTLAWHNQLGYGWFDSLLWAALWGYPTNRIKKRFDGVYGSDWFGGDSGGGFGGGGIFGGGGSFGGGGGGARW